MKYTLFQFLNEHIFQIPVLVFFLVVDAAIISKDSFYHLDLTMVGGVIFTQFVYIIIVLVQWRELKRKRETNENS